MAQETGFFVQTAFKSKANNGNEFVPLVYSSFRSYLTLELKLPIGEVYRNRKLTFQIQPLFDVSDIIPVVESNLGLPNILRDVVVYFTTLDPLIFFLSSNLSDLYLVEESTDCSRQ